MHLKILGIVPARGGSKGVPGKNIRPLGNKPLIAHTLETAMASLCFDRLVASTDSETIAAVARIYRAEVPWLRPPELATDDANIMDAVLYTLDRLKTGEDYVPDAVMLLQPTSPFRSVGTIQDAVKLFQMVGPESVISVSPARDHPYLCKRIDERGVLQDFLSVESKPVNRQQLPHAYSLNGMIYLTALDTLLGKHSFYSDRPHALVVPEEESVDIDTPADWEMAECVWSLRRDKKVV
jgi:CMP-N-acetylneuraminic acid synthetase